MPSYKITYADGSTNNIIANEEWCKNIEGASYELNGELEETQGMINARQREWRNNELLQTDFIVPLTDHPQRNAYLNYRDRLRSWPSTDSFPDTRPTL